MILGSKVACNTGCTAVCGRRSVTREKSSARHTWRDTVTILRPISSAVSHLRPISIPISANLRRISLAHFRLFSAVLTAGLRLVTALFRSLQADVLGAHYHFEDFGWSFAHFFKRDSVGFRLVFGAFFEHADDVLKMEQGRPCSSSSAVKRLRSLVWRCKPHKLSTPNLPLIYP